MENKNNNKNNQLSYRKSYDDFFSPLFDSFFSYPDLINRKNSNYGLLKTDIKELSDKYVLDVEVPGLNKDEININLNDGYLVISTNKKEENEDLDKKGNIIHQERFVGSYKRSFFVGKQVKFSDIDASLDKGVLHISVKKPQPESSENKSIEIK